MILLTSFPKSFVSALESTNINRNLNSNTNKLCWKVFHIFQLLSHVHSHGGRCAGQWWWYGEVDDVD